MKPAAPSKCTSFNTRLHPIVNSINRKPIDVESVEVTNIVYVIAEREHQKKVSKPR